MSFNPGRSQGIMFGDVWIVMNPTIEFDNELAGRAVKIENESFDRMLKAKLQPTQPPGA